MLEGRVFIQGPRALQRATFCTTGGKLGQQCNIILQFNKLPGRIEQVQNDICHLMNMFLLGKGHAPPEWMKKKKIQM